MSRGLRIFSIAPLGLALATFATASWLPSFMTTDYIRDKLIGVVEQRTGKVVTIAGSTKFLIVPRIGIVANDIALANSRDTKDQPLARTGQLQARLAWLPLLKGNVEFTEVTLEAPQFVYKVDADGRSNWQRPTPADKPKASTRSIGLDRVTMNKAQIRYVRAGREDNVFDFDSLVVEQAQIAGGSATDEPLKLAGDFTWRQQPFHVTGMLDRFADLVAGKSARASFDLQSDILSGRYAGSVEPAGKLRFDGTLRAETATLRRFASLFNVDLPGSRGGGAAKLEAVVQGDSDKLEFTTRQLQLDALAFAARGSLKLSGERPRLDADLSGERIDLADYIDTTGSAPKAPTAIRLAGLKALDGRFGVKIERLDYAPLAAERIDAVATLEGGVADIEIRQIAGYGGKGQGTLRLDGRNAVPALAGKLQLKELQAAAVLRDVAAPDKLAGAAGQIDLDLDLATAGETVEAALAALKGTTRFALRDGRAEAYGVERAQVQVVNENDLPAKLTAQLDWRKQPLHLDGTLHRLYDLLAGKPADANLELRSAVASGNFAGKVERPAGAAPRFDGALKASLPSLRETIVAFGGKPPGDRGFGATDCESRAKGVPTAIEFAEGKCKLDGMTIAGKGVLTLAAARPRLDGAFDVDRIDLNNYLAAQPAPPTASAPALSFDLNLAPLKALDGQLAVKFRELVYRIAALQNGDVAATLRDGRLDARINDVTVYRGKAQGNVVLDGSAAQPGVAGKVQIRQTIAGALLRDFAGFDRVSGTGDADIDLAASGKSADAAVATLQGTTQFTLKDGRIDGIDIANMIAVKPENLPAGFSFIAQPRPSPVPGKKVTIYKSMAGRFEVARGIAANNDFLLSGDDFRVKAAGTVNLVERSLVYRVAPTFYASTLLPLTLPVRISGPFGKLKTELDSFAYTSPKPATTTAKTPAKTVASKPDDALATRRGLKSDAEISSFLAGQKIDASKNGTAAAPR